MDHIVPEIKYSPFYSTHICNIRRTQTLDVIVYISSKDRNFFYTLISVQKDPTVLNICYLRIHSKAEHLGAFPWRRKDYFYSLTFVG